MSPQPLFSDPVGVAFDPSGNAWVADYRLSSLPDSMRRT
jgi:NHL repeat